MQRNKGICESVMLGSPVVHMFGVADVDVSAVLLGGESAAPSGERRDDVARNVRQAAAQETSGSKQQQWSQ